MPILWRVRSFVCLLLAVSTAIGAVAPARACACATPAKAPSIPVNERAATPQSATKSCCQPNAKKRACCAPASTGTAKEPCCDNKVPCERPGTSSPTPTPADSPGCHCVRCDCDPPGAPSAPAAPAPAISDLDEHAVASLVPPILIPGPPLVSWRPAQLVPASPPTDLVISLSRLIC